MKTLISELFGQDYEINSNDGEYYIFEAHDKHTATTSWYFHWTELCLFNIPEKLGINYLILPINNPDYNVAQYLVDYYNDMYTKASEKAVKATKKPKFEIIRSLSDIPKDLVNMHKFTNRLHLPATCEDQNMQIGDIIRTHV